jgi:archaellum component FlaF (FlaF/FlaG flagellin family)
MSDMADTDEIADLEASSADAMVDLAYTYKTFFGMSDWSYKIANTIDLISVLTSVGLLQSLVRQTLSNSLHVGMALVITLASFVNVGLNFNKRGNRFEETADAYNSLYKDFRHFKDVTLDNDDLTIEEKRRELDHLLERQQELNELTPSTWNFVFNRLDEEDVLGDIEVTEEERNRV